MEGEGLTLAAESLEALLRRLEERLLQPEVRRSAADVGGLLADQFVEIGSSGRIFNKRQIVEGSQNEPPIRRALTDFKISVLAPGVVLVTYRAVRYGMHGEPSTYSLRSSIWQSIDWQILFHQGTLTTGP